MQIDDRLLRSVGRRDGSTTLTDVGSADRRLTDPDRLRARADLLLLRSAVRPTHPSDPNPIRIVDLFCGIGALSWGAMEAARAVGRGAELVLAADLDQGPLDVLERSLSTSKGVVRAIDLAKALPGYGTEVQDAERTFLQSCAKPIDVVVAGPPCQGHSRLNNHTRHDDPRNDLYACVARFVELRQPRLAIIENVDSVTSDQRGNAAAARRRIEQRGYKVSEGTVHLNRLGVAQTRRRHLLVATRADQPTLEVSAIVTAYTVGQPELRTVDWAIRDLLDADQHAKASPFDRSSTPTPTNLERLRWFDRNPGKLNLPDDQRPDCHRLPKPQKDGTLRRHTYRSMYGRLDPAKPAQTITSGFGSMGQGRYVHPHRARTLTPHEAARLQFIPDFYDFSSVSRRGRLTRMIGNVAPMKLSYPFVVELLR